MKLLYVAALSLVGIAYGAKLSEICGYANRPRARWRALYDNKRGNYIVGGADSSTQEFPWMVSLRYLRNGNTVTKHFCGAAIVAENYVVTAAHCVEVQKPDTPIVVLYQTTDGRMAIKRIRAIHSHPRYNAASMDYDIAILELQDAFDFDGAEQHLKPICLPPANDDVEGWYSCMVAGWGVENHGEKVASTVLLKTDVLITKRDLCRRSYAGLNPITSRMVCAGDYEYGNKGTCQGDSGGPLMCLRNDRRFVLSGVTSWGYNCGKARFPSVFADVGQLMDFVMDVTGLDYRDYV